MKTRSATRPKKSDREKLSIARAQLRAFRALLKVLPTRSEPGSAGGPPVAAFARQPDEPARFVSMTADPRRPVLYALDEDGQVWESVSNKQDDGSYTRWWIPSSMERRTPKPGPSLVETLEKSIAETSAVDRRASGKDGQGA